MTASHQEARRMETELPEWHTALTGDLLIPGPLRVFLKRAGADVPQGLSAMGLLSEAFLVFGADLWDERRFRRTAQAIFTVFPAVTDARWLKEQLFGPAHWSQKRGFEQEEHAAMLLELQRQHDTGIAAHL